MQRRDFCKQGANLAMAAAFYRLLSSSPVMAHLSQELQGGGSLLDLPPGFRCLTIDRLGEAMSDGYLVPGRPDGMACFSGPGDTLILMRNHELDDFDHKLSAYRKGASRPRECYDPQSLGGVSRIVLDRKSLHKISSNMVLLGSARNCAGGVSPWGWLSCEESLQSNHGYVFLCDPRASSLSKPFVIPTYGRFNHEAAVVDKRDYKAYLTEDRSDGCFYRFVPDNRASPFTGKLQGLKIQDEMGVDTGEGLSVGDRFEVGWVDIPQPVTPHDDVRKQAQSRGAAIIRRGEGLWLFEDKVYFSATSGGPLYKGQIFCLHLLPNDTQILELVAQSSDPAQMDMPDNITVHPKGLLFFAEDGSSHQYIRMVGSDGTIKTFARNAYSKSEITGVCFSPDGDTMFLNLQHDGITLAVTGPFSSWIEGG